MDKSKYAIIGGIGVGLLTALFFLKKKFPVGVTQLDKENVLKALQDLKGQTFSLFITTAGVVKKIVAESGGKYEYQPNKNVGDLIRDEVTSQFEEKKRLVLVKYGIDENDFANSIDGQFKDDEDIWNLVNQIFDGLEEALKGNGPSLEVRKEVLEMLTKEKSLFLVRRILINSSMSFLSVFKELEKEGEKNITLQNPKVVRKLGLLNMKERKRKLIQDQGIHVEPDSPTEVLGKVTQKYKEEDESFSQSILNLEKTYTSVLEQLGKGITTDEQIDEAFRQQN